MTGTTTRLPGRAPTEPGIALAAVAALGCGTVLLGTGWATGDLRLTAGGGALLAAALTLLLAAGWMGGLLLLAGVLVLPAPWETGSLRISAAAGVTAVIVTAWVLRWGLSDRPVRLAGFPRRSALALAGAVGIAALFARSPTPAAVELTTVLLLLGLLVAATDELTGSPRTVARLARAVAAVAALAGPLAALEAWGVIPGRFPLEGTGLYRATLGFGWPNELGMFFAICVPLAVHLCRTARGTVARGLAWAVLAGVLAGLLATFSRGSWLAVPAGAAVLLLAGEARTVFRIWLWGAAAVVVLDLASGGAVLSRLASLPQDWVVAQRAALMLTGLLMFQAHPVVGIGPGGFGEHMEQFGLQVSWLWDFVGSAHNTYVQMAAETGLVGLVALLVFGTVAFLVLLRGARHGRRDSDVPPDEQSLRLALLWSFGIILVLGMLEWLLAHGIGQLVVLVMAMGIALEGSSPAPAGKEEEP